MSEFSRMYDPRLLPGTEQVLTASADECAALAKRFDLVRIERLEARIMLDKDGPAVTANGRLTGAIVQSCAVSGEDLPVSIDEPVNLRFVTEGAPAAPDEEIELEADELDEIAYSGSQFDLGEALAQTLALAIDPYAEGPNAEAARQAAGLNKPDTSGPFAALAALKRKD
jgi:uncharacterized metal-binding protein YceD (DUF177 family)